MSLESDQQQASVIREELGKRVRQYWLEWAKQQPDPRPSWLLPWEELDESQREADRQIGAGMFAEFVGLKTDIVSSVLGCLNDAFARDPATLATICAVRHVCNRDLVDHPHIPVEPCAAVPGNAVLSVLGLINGVLAALELPLVCQEWSEPGPNGARRMTGFRIWYPDGVRPAEPTAVATPEPTPEAAPEASGEPTQSMEWNSGWNSKPPEVM